MGSAAIRKNFREEILGFSESGGLIKTVPGSQVTKPDKKDFLVHLPSLKDELAHMTLMFLKPQNS
ncbi:hypothetical protein [Vibrio mangrovi]|uniref:Uncharacterized protein n=1 Tax=Vibrio mangrovi TaxID=474394 RepID=A0ABU4I4Q5_9VIBR|nr:hypothetical protein [Vibrio mangrovi]MDW6002834.1 hypothetical protein [Vibrio mangrovi]